jgi:predicted dehydrogenase
MRVVIAGLGSIGRRHQANLHALRPGVEVLVVKTPRDLHECMALPLHAALICTPSSTRLEYLLPLLDAGIPCYVEKPLISSMEDARALRDYVSRATRVPVVAVGCNLRALPSLQRMREAVARGDLGKVVRASLIAGQWLPDWRPGQDYRRSYSARAQRGGGVILDLVHEIDMARWLFGPLKMRCAAAGHLSRLDIETEDVASLILCGERGAPLVSISLDYVSRRRVRRYEVVGDEGSMLWDLDRALLERSDAEGTRTICSAAQDFDVAATYAESLERFLEGEPACGLLDGLQSAELALQARREALRCES